MDKIRKPYWLLITLSFPQVFIFVSFWKIFWLIRSQLFSGNIAAWIGFAAGLGVIWLIFTVYGSAMQLTKKNVDPRIGLAILGTYLLFLYIFFSKAAFLIPTTIPRWMLQEINPEMTLLTLITPALAYAMICLVAWQTPPGNRLQIRTNLYFMIGIPVFWFVSLFFIIPALTYQISSELTHNLISYLIMMLVVSTVCFIYFTIRFFYMLLQNKSPFWLKARIPVILIFPALSLFLLNSAGQILGDFSNAFFYIFCLLCSAVIITPATEQIRRRYFLFGAKSILFPFSFYLFVVFLPYLPFSVLLIFLAGLGLLIMAPLVLLMALLKSLWLDYHYLASLIRRRVLWITFGVGCLLLPCLVLLTFYNDRINLDHALNFVYRRSLTDTQEYHFNLNSIQRAVKNIELVNAVDQENFFDAMRGRIPYLSGIYRFVVLDNLTLSNRKLHMLKRVFWQEPAYQFAPGSTDSHQGREGAEEEDFEWQASMPPGEFQHDNVKIDGYQVETKLDPQTRAFNSWIHFRIKNESVLDDQGYYTTFELPGNCFIGNYYLEVGNHKKFGLLSDKRAAEWIFQQIVRARKDPGLLSYQNNHSVAWRVFPFRAGEIRKSGIKIIHHTPVQLRIGGKTITLAAPGHLPNRSVIRIDNHLFYIPAGVKQTLSLVSRRPEYYFLLDCSTAGRKEKVTEYCQRVRRFVRMNHLPPTAIRVVGVNYNYRIFGYDAVWEKKIGKMPLQGGFYIERVIQSVLYRNHIAVTPEYPVFITVTDDFSKAIITDSFTAMQGAFPESDQYYHLSRQGQLYSHSYLKNPSVVRKVPQLASYQVFAWPDAIRPQAYLSKNSTDALVVLPKPFKASRVDFTKNSWENGLRLQAMYQEMAFHPEDCAVKSLEIIQDSFKSKIMTPLTSYIVLENEAQEKVLLEKQRRMLSTRRALDLSRMVMDEPPWQVLFPLFLVIVLILKYRHKIWFRYLQVIQKRE